MKNRREEFKKRLVGTNREGVDKLFEYLDMGTDFFTAPASSSYHNNVDHGLVDHSLNVADKMIELNESQGLEIPIESIELAGLLHDVCKANYYKKDERWFKDDNNKWQSYNGYVVDEQIPLGHGDKSIIVVNRFIQLSIPEMAAMRFHMGAYELGTQMQFDLKNQYFECVKRYPIVTLIQVADLLSARFLEEAVDLKVVNLIPKKKY